MSFLKNVSICDERIDKTISRALMSTFIILTFQYLILISFDLLGSSAASLVQSISKIIVGLIFLIALPHVLKRKLNLFIIVYGLAIITFGYNYLVFPENHTYLINIIFPFFFMALPSFIYVLSIERLEIFEEITNKSAFVIFILGIIAAILILTGNASAGAYSMSLSYYMLLPALVFLGKVFERGKVHFIVYSIIALIVIVALGSRGTLLCIVIYTFLRVVSPKQKFTSVKFMIYGILTLSITIIIYNYDRILLYFNELFLSYGIQSRTLALLLQGEINLSGRDTIIQTVWSEIKLSPILGIGLAGDARLARSGYAHNFFIEVIGNFGIPVGMLLIGILLTIILLSLIRSNYYDMIVLWISIGFVHLTVSSSYITDLKFWVFFGVLLISLKGLINTKQEIKRG